MKTIVVSGARSEVGKTTLAKELVALLPGSAFVKIGHHPKNNSKGDLLYPMGTSFRELCLRHGDSSYLIIESNSILNEVSPDCAIFLDAENPKPSAAMAKKKANLISGKCADAATIKALSGRLGIDVITMRRIAWLSGARPSPLTVIILAGGKSTRMGTNKALLTVNGITLVERLIKLFRPLCDHVLVCTGATSAFSNAFPTVADQYPELGPISGIHAGLAASKTENNFVIACDIPHVNLGVMNKLLAFSEEYDIAAPCFQNSQPEPLFAFYHKRVAEIALRLLLKRKLKARFLLEECNSIVRQFPDADWYVNLNSPGDFQRFLYGLETNSGEGVTSEDHVASFCQPSKRETAV
jgi:molybdopterin-guanine dinucleotide biosynthesis protein A